MIVIPNQNLFRIANERTTFSEAFGMADQVLHSGVRSIPDLMVLPGLINLDFADVRTVMTEMGKAMMGTGEATGEDRALMAAQNAIANPLLDEVSLKGAKAVLVNVTGGLDMTLLEVDEAANAISDQVDPEANIIFGAAFDPALEGMIRVSVVATGMDGASIQAIEPKAIPRANIAPPTLKISDAPAYSAPTSPAAAAPVAAAPEPAFAPPPAPEPAPEPLVQQRAAEPIRQQSDFSFANPEPSVVEVARPAPVTRIVDPAVAEEEDEPLFADSNFGGERREQKGGWLSLFGGRPRYEPQPMSHPAPQQRAVAGGRPAPLAAEEAQPEESDDLEIPSFLRRLAN
jgi:cell division protein FtsZ